jgi:hypothetical protein
LLANAKADTCGVLGFVEYHAILDTVLRNPAMKKSRELRGAANYFKAIALQTTGELDSALSYLDLSYEAEAEIGIRFRQIVWLLAAGRADDAAHYLSLARQHSGSARRAEDLAILQQRIDQAIR